MWRRLTSATLAVSSPSGFTVVELLVALAMATTVGLLALSGYAYVTHEWIGQSQRLDTQQRLRDAIDTVTRDLRLAGNCLPTTGPADGSIAPLAGTDSGMTDTLTVRFNLLCANGTVQSAVSIGATQVHLDNVQNFTVGSWAYLLSADTTFGQYFLISSVNQSTSVLRVDPSTPITASYPTSSAVYGVASHTYQIDASGAVPVLTLTQLGGTAQRAVAGIEIFDIQYVLNNPTGCNADAGTCTIVDLPATASDWASVRLVQLTIGSRSSQQVTGAGVNGIFHLREQIRVKPRNFIF